MNRTDRAIGRSPSHGIFEKVLANYKVSEEVSMHRIRIIAVCAILAISAAGCFGGNKIVSIDKTVLHKGGTINVSNIGSISGVLEGRSAGREWQSLTGKSDKDLEAWYRSAQSPDARSYIQFDSYSLELDNRRVASAGDLKKMSDNLQSRVQEVNKFTANDKKQLDARKW